VSEAAASEGRVTPLMGQYAAQMRPWVRFMSVLTFLAAAFAMIVGAFFALALTLAGVAAQEATGSRFGALGGAVIGVVYILLGVLYIPPGVFLHRTASAIKRMQAGDATSALEDVLKNQKSFWRFVGILSVVGICITVLAFVVGIGAAVLIPMLSRPS
jgi:hypothetical protein